ncbi:MAG: glycosyltransferase, partial [Verrucomicrobia bacterium]|nr:glycosyltransferase [Verrucomicrobiota bacterium]
MRYLSLNFGDAHCASSQFRIHAFVPSLRERGMTLECVPADAFTAWETLGDYDGVIVQKKLFGALRVRALRARARRLVYDIDDAIWLPHRRRHHWLTRWRTNGRLQRIAAAADLCLPANGVLAEHLRPWVRRLEVFPMALDASQWRPQPRPDDGTVRLGWSGAPGNLRYLEALEPALATLLERHPQARLVVLCGERPRFTRLAFEHVRWQPGAEPAVVMSFDIGLLPLEESLFAAGKSPIKGLQYLACGLPVVATPLAATRELFAGSDAASFAAQPAVWVAELTALVTDAELRQRRGAAGRAHFEARYALARQADRLH